jgi:hypothetical protein
VAPSTDEDGSLDALSDGLIAAVGRIVVLPRPPLVEGTVEMVVDDVPDAPPVLMGILSVGVDEEEVKEEKVEEEVGVVLVKEMVADVVVVVEVVVVGGLVQVCWERDSLISAGSRRSWQGHVGSRDAHSSRIVRVWVPPHTDPVLLTHSDHTSV